MSVGLNITYWNKGLEINSILELGILLHNICNFSTDNRKRVTAITYARIRPKISC